MADTVQLMDKADEALEEWIKSLRGSDLRFTDRDGNVTEIPIYRAFRGATEIELPIISIVAVRSEQRHVAMPGNYNVEGVIELVSESRGADGADHKAWAGRLEAILDRSDVETGINALATKPADFTIENWEHQATVRALESETVDVESAIVHRFEWEMHAFAS